MSEWFTAASLTELSGTAVLAAVALLVITDKLVWHKRLKAEQDARKRWEEIALRSLGVTEKLTVQSELTNDVLTRLPDPAKGAQGP